MDDLFDKHFADNNNCNKNQQQQQQGTKQQQQQGSGTDVDDNSDNSGGFIWNTFKKMMPNVNIEVKSSSNFGGTRSSTSRSYSTTSYSTSSSTSGSSRRGGSRSSSTHSSSSSSSHSNSGSNNRKSTYTSRSTRTEIQNDGQRVTIQSLEKDGNKIEERYIGEMLIERKINGRKEDITGRIEQQGNGNEGARGEF